MVFLVLAALSRWPKLFPPSFSVFYAVAFCAGVYFTKAMAWWVPLGTLLITDVALNCYYEHEGWPAWTSQTIELLSFNYLGYAGIIWLGRRFKPQSKFFTLLTGGLFGGLLFYLVTNTASWLLNPFHNPEYARSLSGWLIAIINGTDGWPPAWQFFRGTLLSSALFTSLFVAAAKLSAAESPAEKEAGVRAKADDEETEPAEEASA